MAADTRAFVSPGVYIREYDFSAYQPALSSTIFGVVITARKGALNVPTFCTSQADFFTKFEEPRSDYLGMYAALQFLSKGSRLWVVRVGGPSVETATADIAGEASAGTTTGATQGPFIIEAPTAGSLTGTEVENFTISVPARGEVTGAATENFNITASTRGEHTGTVAEVYTIADPTRAEVVGSAAELFTVTVGVDDQLKVAADGNPAETITLAPGIGLTAAVVAADIASKATTFSADAVGPNVRLFSPITGASSAIDIQAVVGDCYTVLGYTVGTTSGTDGTQTLRVNGDGVGIETITLATGVGFTAAQVAADITSKAVNFAAEDTGGGRVRLFSNTTGAASTIQVLTGLDNPNAVLGFTVGTYAGTDGNDKLKVAGDVNPAENIVLTPGVGLSAAVIAADISGSAVNFASDATGGKVRLFSLTTGAASAVDVQATAGSCYAELGITVGTYAGNAGTNRLKIAVDGGGPQTVSLVAGTFSAVDIALAINAGTSGLTASDDGDGRVMLTSNLTGAASSIEIQTITENAYTVLGFSVGTGTGEDGTDVLDIKIDGGGTQSVTLTAGAARTATQVVADIALVLTGATADVSSEKVRITSDTLGGLSSVQILSSSTADAVLGFDNDVHSGVPSGGATIQVDGLSPGTWGNDISIVISNGTRSGFKMEVLYKDVPIDKYDNLSYESTSPDYFMLKVIGSRYIVLTDVGGESRPENGTYDLAGGTDGISDVTDAHYRGTTLPKTGLELFKNPELIDINLMAVPGISGRTVLEKEIQICTQRADCMCLLDSPLGLDVDDVIDWHNGEGLWTGQLQFDSSYAAIFWPWVKVGDPYTGDGTGTIWVAPSGFAAAACAYTDYVADPWFAIAGLNRGKLDGALAVEVDTSVEDRDKLYGGGNAVNPIVNFRQFGIVLWGQRTTQRATTSLDRINVRRMILYLRKIVATTVIYLDFDPNDTLTRLAFINMVEPYLQSVKQRRGLYSYEIVCDDTNNPTETVDRNELRGQIKLKPMKTAEVIIVDFALYSTGASFS